MFVDQVHLRSQYQHESEKVLVTLSFLTLCDSINCFPPGSSVHGICQAEYWNGQPFLSPRALPDTGIKPESPTLQADSLPSEPPRKSQYYLGTTTTKKNPTNIYYHHESCDHTLNVTFNYLENIQILLLALYYVYIVLWIFFY